MLNFGVVIQAVFLVISLLVCKQLLGRFSDDLEEFQTADSGTRIPIAIWWGIGVLSTLYAGASIWTIVARFF